MDWLMYPLALIVTLGLLVSIHELGHFLIARAAGVHVLRFSIGFGRPIWSRRDRHGTEFAVTAIPLGGYVRMLDHPETDTQFQVPEGATTYHELTPWWRIAIALGGPLANFLLAVVVYWCLFVAGSTSVAPMVAAPPPESPVALAGLQDGMEILAVDGTATPSWQQVSMALAARLGDTGAIEMTAAFPGSGHVRQFDVAIDSWHQGVDEPELLGSLGIQPTVPPVFSQVIADSPAQQAGLRPWDRVVAINGDALTTWASWVEQVQAAPETPLTLTVDRGGQTLSMTLRPERRTTADGSPYGYAGVAPHTREVRYGWLQAIPESLRETGDKTLLTLGLLKKMVTGAVSMANLSGPITIAQVAGDSARLGWQFFLGVLALLSISLGVLNLLPIPILDGGHVLFCLAEALRGRPVSERAQIVGTQIGLFLVGSLMILALYNDIARLF